MRIFGLSRKLPFVLARFRFYPSPVLPRPEQEVAFRQSTSFLFSFVHLASLKDLGGNAYTFGCVCRIESLRIRPPRR